jgi:hypothetical protein
MSQQRVRGLQMAVADIEAAHAESPAYPTATGRHLR